jgi:hypothetical protein
MVNVTAPRTEDEPACAVGETCFWSFTDTDSGRGVHAQGMLLGYGTSQRQHHNHSSDENSTSPCSACRWFEVRIVRAVDTDEYIVSYRGCTTIPGEDLRETLHTTRSPHTVIEVLTQHRNDHTFIPRTSRLALSEAAAYDDGIEQAWIDRAVD